MIGCGTGGRGARTGTTGSQMDGHVAGSHVGYRHGNEERRDMAMPGLLEKGMIALYHREASHTTADEYPGMMCIGFGDPEARILQGHDTGAQGILGKRIHLLDVFFLYI